MERVSNLNFPPYLYEMLLSAGLGMLLGLERAIRKKDASITTFALVSLGSFLFTRVGVETITSWEGATADPLRVAAQIVSGVGFVGAGVIFKDHDHVAGITTAVMIWMAASIGMACGLSMTDLALWAVVVYFLVIFISRAVHCLVGIVYEK